MGNTAARLFLVTDRTLDPVLVTVVLCHGVIVLDLTGISASAVTVGVAGVIESVLRLSVFLAVIFHAVMPMVGGVKLKCRVGGVGVRKP